MASTTSSCTSCGATYRGRLAVCPNCQSIIEPSRGDGQMFDGKYIIEGLLSTDGTGDVFKARHLYLDVFRTIKTLRKDLLADESQRARFSREAQLATRVQHRNVALVHDFAALPDGSSYVVSEFIEGVTLRQWMQTHPRFEVDTALQIAAQVLAGLEVIHRAGLVHRHLSPENIMIAAGSDTTPVAKIINLGIAKAIDAPPGDTTRDGMFLRDLRYSSPELLGALREDEVLDARADLYSFGGVLYEMLAGAPPFDSSTPHGYAAQHLSQPAPSLRTHDPSVPEALDAIVLRALNKDRTERYVSAREMAVALAAFATGHVPKTTQVKLAPLLEEAMTQLETALPTTDEPPLLTDRATFDAAVDALRAGNRQPAENLLQNTSVPHIRQRLKVLLKSIPDPARERWNAAMAENTERAWTEFIEQSRGTPLGAKAIPILAELRDYERAAAAGTELALRMYIATWPRGRHHAAVATRLRAILENSAKTLPSGAPEASARPPAGVDRFSGVVPHTILSSIDATQAPRPLDHAHHFLRRWWVQLRRWFQR